MGEQEPKIESNDYVNARLEIKLTMGQIDELIGDLEAYNLQDSDLWDQFIEQKNALEVVQYKLRLLKEKVEK